MEETLENNKYTRFIKAAEDVGFTDSQIDFLWDLVMVELIKGE